MYIQALEAQNFKKLKKEKIEFPKDVTVIKGDNESGKSTFLEALIAVLFFDPTPHAAPQYIQELKNWNSDRLYNLKLYFEAEGGEYILEKDFENKKVLLSEKEGEVISHDFKEVSSLLKRWGGYVYRYLFERYFVIKKDALLLIDQDKKKIVEILQDMIGGSSAEVSVTELITNLEKTQKKLEKGLDSSRPVKNAGKIKMARDRARELTENLRKMKEQLSSKNEKQSKLEEINKKIEELQDKHALFEKEYEANREYFEAKKEIKKIDEELNTVMNDLEKWESLEKEKKELEEKVESTEIPSPEDIESVERINARIESLKEQLEELKGKIQTLEGKDKKVYYPTTKMFMIEAGVLFVLGFMGILWAVFYAAWVVLIGLAVWYFATGTYKKYKTLKDLKKEENQVEKELESKQKELDKYVSKFGVKSTSEFKDLNKSISEANARIKEINQQQSLVLRDKDPQALKDKRRELEKQLGTQEGRLTEDQKTNPPDTKRQKELEHEKVKIEKDLEKYRNQYSELKGELKSLQVTDEEIQDTENKLNTLKEEIASMEKRARVYGIIKEALEEARLRSLHKTKDKLAESIEEYLSEITSGRYTDIKISDDFDIQVYSPEKEDYVDIHHLSTGTIDQIYIVARFGIINLLYGKKESSTGKEVRPVVVLDDPFVNFDEKRKNNMQHLILRLARDFQIIILTASGNYDKWGEVVKL